MATVRQELDPDEVNAAWQEFHQLVNMTSRELRDWLASEPAQQVPEPTDDASSAQEAGRRVVALLAKRRTDLTLDDLTFMREVVATIRGLQDDAVDSAGGTDDAAGRDDLRRRTLMVLGHDPLRAA
jgi:hypothetical protein